MRSVISSIEGKTMPVTTSRVIVPQHFTFGGTSGSEILKIKQKQMPKNDLDVKNLISNYLEQQELPSSTCSIRTTVLSEACCEDGETLEASLICWPSGNIGCSSIA